MEFEFRDIDLIKIGDEYYTQLLWNDDDINYGKVDIDSHIILTKNFKKFKVRKNLKEMIRFQVKFNSNKELTELVNNKIFFNN